MNKTVLIIKREYLTRVKKRSFIVMTILGPILMAALFIVPVYIATMRTGVKKIQVVDETGLFAHRLESNENIVFLPLSSDIEAAKNLFTKSGDDALLYIPKTELSVPTTAFLYFDQQPSIAMKSHITASMRKEVESLKLGAHGIDEDILRSIETDIRINTIKIHESGKEEKKYTEIATVLGFIAAIIIYFFIFMFGTMVLRGVIEEKTNRIIEVIVSSVKPFQLMTGKIIGVGMVGLTQFLLWVVLTLVIVTGFQQAFPEKFRLNQTEQATVLDTRIPTATQPAFPAEQHIAETTMSRVIEGIMSINFGVVIFSFVFFFLGGYLLYGALFAAIGAAVDSETDSQQFMLPITIPLIFAIIMAQYVINDPNSQLSFWLSIIPFTSPIIMMIRIPFGVPYFDLILSMVLLILGFLGTTWLAGKIYRTGILMYGKKVDYAELWKWIRYRA